MAKILISIRPEHVENIISGDKKFEYRTRIAKHKISSLIVYATSPIKKIIAEVEVTEIIAATPEELWEKTKEQSGIAKVFFDKYFKNRKIAYAYALGNVTVFNPPKNLSEFGVKRAPQFIIYLL